MACNFPWPSPAIRVVALRDTERLIESEGADERKKTPNAFQTSNPNIRLLSENGKQFSLVFGYILDKLIHVRYFACCFQSSLDGLASILSPDHK